MMYPSPKKQTKYKRKIRKRRLNTKPIRHTGVRR